MCRPLGRLTPHDLRACLQARALLFTLPTAIQLLWRVEAVESAAAEALWVPAAPSHPTPAATDGAAAEGKCGGSDLEAGGDSVAAEGAAKGDGDGAPGVPAGAPAAERATAAGAPQPAPKRGLLGNPYVRNVATLLALVTSAAAWGAIIRGTVQACSGLPAALSSRAAFAAGAPPGGRWVHGGGAWGCMGSPARRRTRLCRAPICAAAELVTRGSPGLPLLCCAALRRPANQFAFKYWLGLSLSMMGTQLFIWKVRRVECCPLHIALRSTGHSGGHSAAPCTLPRTLPDTAADAALPLCHCWTAANGGSAVPACLQGPRIVDLFSESTLFFNWWVVWGGWVL